MREILKKRINLLAFLLLFCLGKSFANHIYGGELYYTHLGSNLYKVTLVIYGDCSSTASLISGLYTAVPQINVYEGMSLRRSMSLQVESGAGTEITPVCSSSLGSTACSGGTLPGIRKFSYSDTITIPASTSLWRIRFDGTLASGTSAGRTGSITNLVSPATSIMALEATLNNASQPNSSPRYTTVPTPFFCIHVNQEYNPGTVDSNTTDSLAYILVDALEPRGGTATYRTSYSGSYPLASASGTFTFSNLTGQLSFTPNLTQRSVVVYKVSEYRDGVLVGTSMREMNFIVLSTCSNKSPFGKISNNNVGAIINNTMINVCKNDTLITFNINPVDSDGNKITMSVKGLPPGAILNINYNGTDTPRTSFSWNTSSISSGIYTFFITYQDDACPLNSRQTVAYTINLNIKPTFTIKVIDSLSCRHKEIFDILSGSGVSSGWSYEIHQSSSLLKSFLVSGTTAKDSLSEGNYILRIKTEYGCRSDTQNYVITPLANVSFDSINSHNPDCFGDNSGRISVSAATGAAPFSFSLDGGSYNDSGIFNGLAAKTYSIRVQDRKNCTRDTSFTLQNPDKLGILVISSALNCFGDSSGKAVVSASGGTSPYLYSIDGIKYSSTDTFFHLYAKDYTVIVRDNNGCLEDSSFTIRNPGKVSISLGISPLNCFGDSSGKLTITTSGGSSPYTYRLNGSAFSGIDSFTRLYAGIYTVSTKDSKGCIKDSIFTLSNPGKVGMSLSLENPACYGDTSGSINIIGSGGTAPYTYRVDGSAYTSSGSFGSLYAKSYTISVRDSKTCTKDSIVSLADPEKLGISLSVLNPLCYGDSSGKTSITAIGGIAPYMYRLDTGSYGSLTTYTNLYARSYTVRIKDSKGCTKDSSYSLADPPKISADLLGTKTQCFGSSDGSLSIVPHSGTAPYSYRVDAGVSTTILPIRGLSYGIHTLHISDINNCKTDTVFFITQPDAISILHSVKRPICKNVRSGKINLYASGGTPPYTYADSSIGTFRSIPVFDSLLSGKYTFLVKDNNNCIQSQIVDVTDSLSLAAEIFITDASCYGGKNGQVSLNPINGEKPYTYTIVGTGSSLRSTSLFDSLSAGTYTFRIVDNNGCNFDTGIKVGEAGALYISAKTETPGCAGKKDGAITILSTGGTPPYTYTLGTTAMRSIPKFDTLGTGRYLLGIQDSKGCTKDTSILLAEPESIRFALDIRQPLCFGDTNGVLLISAVGGTPDYIYRIDALPEQSSSRIESVNAGTHRVSVSDRNGCQKDTSIVVAEPPPLNFQELLIVPATCEGYRDGSINVKGAGGTPSYQYALGESSVFQSNGRFESLAENNYTIMIRDSNQCSLDTNISLNGYPKIKLDSTFTIPENCYGSKDGSLELFASGGNPPLRYTMAGSMDSLRRGAYKSLAGGIYNITVSDITSCSKTFSITLMPPDSIQILMDILPNDCTGDDKNGVIIANVNGGTSPYGYLWSVTDNNTGVSISNLANGTYTLQITDAHNCKAEAKAEISYGNCCKPGIPNAFTPNNDGKNDVFHILYKGDIILKEFAVYNRYGECVFRTNNINEGWDGYYKGQPELMGVYYYMVKIICGNNKDKEILLKGDVTLIR